MFKWLVSNGADMNQVDIQIVSPFMTVMWYHQVSGSQFRCLGVSYELLQRGVCFDGIGAVSKRELE